MGAWMARWKDATSFDVGTVATLRIVTLRQRFGGNAEIRLVLRH
jgi:hypothetical protein